MSLECFSSAAEMLERRFTADRSSFKQFISEVIA
jgi:hypothetical protein